MKKLEEIALEVRKKIIKMNYVSGSGHITSAFSCVELLVTLYFNDILKYNTKNPSWIGRDYFVLSKGHAALGLYCVLSKLGYFPESELWTFCSPGSRLGGHPTSKIPGVETSSGSLGHGLSLAVGISLGLRMRNMQNMVYCLTGDGELQEGSVWEAALSIAHFNLTNLVWIIDRNNLQIVDSTEKVMALDSIVNKLESFNFDVYEIDGHDFSEINTVLRTRSNKPIVIIANTVKGYGAPSIAGKLGWHGKKPSKQELCAILEELDMTMEDLQIEKNI